MEALFHKTCGGECKNGGEVTWSLALNCLIKIYKKHT